MNPLLPHLQLAALLVAFVLAASETVQRNRPRGEGFAAWAWALAAWLAAAVSTHAAPLAAVAAPLAAAAAWAAPAVGVWFWLWWTGRWPAGMGGIPPWALPAAAMGATAAIHALAPASPWAALAHLPAVVLTALALADAVRGAGAVRPVPVDRVATAAAAVVAALLTAWPSAAAQAAGAVTWSAALWYAYATAPRSAYPLLSRAAVCTALFHEVFDPLIVCGQDGAVVRINRPAARAFNIGWDTQHHRTVDAILPPDLDGDLWQCDDRTWRVQRIDAAPEQRFGLRIVSLWDVSDQERAKQELRAVRDELAAQSKQRVARVRLAQRLEAMAAVSGAIAHDFNNLLTSILGYATAAREELPDRHPVREDLDEIAAAAQRAASMVRRMLSFAGAGPGVHTPHDAAALVHETIKMLRNDIPDEVEVVVQPPGEPLFTAVDPVRFHQILSNLVTNALAAMPGGGTLSITVGEQRFYAPRTCAVGTVEVGAYVAVSVADTGVGMDSRTLSRIFEPFFTTRPREGHGIGLATVAQAVGEHEGAIAVTSEPGRGTEFTVYLPRASEDAPRRTTPSPDASDGAVLRAAVAMVDDNRQILRVQERMLAPLGYAVAAFDHPHRARDAFDANPDAWDVLLVDYLLPDMNGLELVAHIQKKRPDLPVILVSGNFPDGAQQRALAMGVAACLTKPVGQRQLRTAVRKVLGAAAARRRP